MFIWRDLGGPRIRLAFYTGWLAVVLSFPSTASPCSCAWEGSFLSVAPKAPLIVRGRVLRHHSGQHPTMDVLVLEVLSGGLLGTGLNIQMGDGMQCRPALGGFPVDTEWILALNGPGAKPGKGWALSHCGEYWLRVQGGEVVGSLTGAQAEQRRMPLRELRLRLRYPNGRQELRGRVANGQRFLKDFGPGFQFVLAPWQTGWEMVILETGRPENLARLTPPLHFASNPREIEGWQFAEFSPNCPRPYQAETGPKNPRHFIFSPEVGREISGPQANRSVTPEEIEAVRRFGRGVFEIQRVSLSPTKNGCPQLEWIEFAVDLEWGI